MEDKIIYSYKDLKVWQRSIEMVKATYELTSHFPKEEQYGLTSQMRRAAISIPSNIAEGRYRGTRKDFINFLRAAFASGAELETQVIISKSMKFTSTNNFKELDRLLLEVMKMLNSMIRKLKLETSEAKKLTSSRGYVTLMTVLIMTAVGVAIGTSLLLLGVSATQSSQTITRANEAGALADACAEDALQRLRLNSATIGTSNLSLGNGSCSYTISSGAGENRTIDSSGVVGTVTRKVKVELDQLTPNINVTSWQEVADF